jgi:hypothetical protein
MTEESFKNCASILYYSSVHSGSDPEQGWPPDTSHNVWVFVQNILINVILGKQSAS